MSDTTLTQKVIFAVTATYLIYYTTCRLPSIQKKKAKAQRLRQATSYKGKDNKGAVRESASGSFSAPAPHKDTLEDKSLHGRVLPNVGINQIRIHDIPTLQSHFDPANIANDCGASYNKIMGKEDFVVQDIVRKFNTSGMTDAFVRAGPRSVTHFDPSKVKAAIVTCGGLCPGLNNVVRELVLSLANLYGVETVYGVRGGYNGFLGLPGFEPIMLTKKSVADIHTVGGSVLASSRGGFDLEKILQWLKDREVSHLYIIGGDGTHRGAFKISQECIAQEMNVSVVGVPKTIDNDIDLIDRSFGFTTSVEAAQAAITSAKTEARCNMPNGIGIVKLMGRSAGFIASHATLASGVVDLCLVPEVSIQLEGNSGCLPYLMEKVQENGHAVVVVAEGAGEELLGESAEMDAGGNKKLPAIGEFMKKQVTSFFKKNGMEATIKYIDPSYMIRSVAANASDSLMCMLLAQNSVHGAMAGYTAFSTGLVNNRVVYIPITRLVATSPRVMDPYGRTWERVLASTGQPNTDAAINAAASTVNDRTTV
jgi:6-phosphofructokinase 1